MLAKVSVVVPVYNIEKYLGECIDSVIAQTIDFDKEVEIILVNDGSIDASEAICVRYRSMYPNNIKYVSQNNAGVSAARNTGLQHASGRYVAFIDGDDKLSPDYFEHMLSMLEDNPRLPLASARIKWFDAKDEYHVADYKFVNTRIIDLDAEPNIFTSLVSSVVFRMDMLSNIYFDTKMTHNEDAKFIDTVLFESGEHKCGVVREAEFLYRKREEQSSASDSAKERRSYYSSAIQYANFYADVRKKTLNGTMPKFLQFHALYHYRWRFTQAKKPDVLTNAEWIEYKQAILKGIKALDIETIIRGSVNLNLAQKMALLHVKFDGNKHKIHEAINEDSKLRDVLYKDIRFTVNLINYSHEVGITIEGSLPFTDPELFNSKLQVFIDDRELSYKTTNSTVMMFDQELLSATTFNIALPKEDRGKFSVRLTDKSGSFKSLELAYTMTSRISMRRSDYRVLKRKILLMPHGNFLQIADFALVRIAKREAVLFLQNILINKYNIPHNAIKSVAVELVRLAALLSIRLRPSRIWLFSDRSISGGDNSEVLFKYTSEQDDSNIKPYFVVNKSAPSYSRLKSAGYRVVPFKSIRHLYLAIVSEVILPSHMDMMYLYPWFGVWQKYCGLIQYDIAHTQHGIVLNDLSGYISRSKKNASIFLSACEWEQKHLVDGSYGYAPEQVPITGLPRYDELKDSSGTKSQKIIALHPTWRSWLAGESKDGTRHYNKKFIDSDYYKFYQLLINDSRILEALRRNDFIMKFYVHPNHNANKSDFLIENDRVQLMDFPYDYNKMFSESDIFVTDYSNTLFDFAYLRKPVIHTQFDFETFFTKHGSITKQLFDYKTEGFGPVADDYESAVVSIIKHLESDQPLGKQYRHNIDKFFTYDDRNNSARAYEAIKNYYLANR